MANNTTSRFLIDNGLDNNSTIIINVADPVNNTDAATKNSFSNASNLSSGTLNGNNITIQTTNYTVSGTTPPTSLTPGVIAINSTDGNAWFVSNGGGVPQVNQLLTVGSNFATTVSQTAYYRQTVLSGPSDLVTSQPNYMIYNGYGYINLANTGDNIIVSFANGFGNNTDIQETINLTGGNITIVSTSNIAQRQYVYTTYSPITSSISYGITQIPPEYGTKYPASSRARLQFNGTDELLYSTGDGKTLLRDYYGNQWNKPGGKYSVTYQDGGFLGKRSALFGVNGYGVGTSVLDCNDITSLGVGPWNIGFYVKFNQTLPTSGTLIIMRADNATYNTGGYGVALVLSFAATGCQLTLALSSNGTSWDLVNSAISTIQTSLITPQQWIYFNLSFTGSQYVMGYAIPGVQNNMTWYTGATSSAIICPISHLIFGECFGSTATVIPFQIDDFSFAPYSLYVQGPTNASTVTYPVVSGDTYGNSTNNIEGDYFNIQTMTMNSLNTSMGANLVTNTISSISSSVLYTPVPHNFVGGERVLFDSIGYAGYAIPAGLSAQTTYYVINPVSTSTAAYIINGTTYPAVNTYSFQVTTSVGGTAVSITGTYTGGMSYTQSTAMEQNNQYINAYFDYVDNSFWTKDVAHGLENGDTVSFYTTTPGGTSSNNSYYAIAISENKFAISSTKTTSTISPSITSLVNLNSVTPFTSAISSVYGNGLFVVVGNSGSATTSFYYSVDGTYWQTGTLPSGLWSQVIFCQPSTGTGFFFAMSDDAHAVTSTDGAFWTIVTIPSSNAIKGITYDIAHSYLIYSSATSAYYASATAYNTVGSFTAYTSVIPSSCSLASGYIGTTWYNIAVVVGTSGTTNYYSTNGTSWTAGGALPTAQYWKKVVYSGTGSSTQQFSVIPWQSSAGTGVAVTATANSSNGTSWSSGALSSDNWLDGTIVNNLFSWYGLTTTFTQTFGGTGVTRTPAQTGYCTWSTAGASTTNSTLLPYTTAFSACYGNGKFLVVNPTGFYISQNYGTTWQKINGTSTNLSLLSAGVYPQITYGKGIYLKPGYLSSMTTPNQLAYIANTAFLVPSGVCGTTTLTDGRTLTIFGPSYFGTAGPGNTMTWSTGTTPPVSGLSWVPIVTIPNTNTVIAMGGWNGTTANNGIWFGTVTPGSTTISWATSTSTMPTAVWGHQITLLNATTLVLTGGATNVSGSATVNQSYVGTISGTTISWSSNQTGIGAIVMHQCNQIAPNKVLVTGGWNGTAYISNTWIGTISGSTISWTAGTALPISLGQHSAVTLPDNRVLILGGKTTTTPITNTYYASISGTTITYTASTALPSANCEASATLLQNGAVIVIGGNNGTTTLSSVSTVIPNSPTQSYSYLRSFDGYTWESINLSSAFSTSIIGPSCYGAGRFVTVGYCAQTGLTTGSTVSAYSTDDGTTWTTGGVLPSTNLWCGVFYNGNNFVAWNQQNTSNAYSPTGVSWTTSTFPIIPLYAFFAPTISSSVSGGGYHVIISSGGAVSVYPLGGSYSSVSALPSAPAVPAGNPGAKIAASDGKIIVVISNGVFYYATVGVWTWTTVTDTRFAPASGSVYSASIDYRDGLWVYFSNTYVLYSNDGINWTQSQSVGNTNTSNCSVLVHKGMAATHWTSASGVYNHSSLTSYAANYSVGFTNSNIGIIQALPQSNLTQIQRVYLGEFEPSTSTLTTYNYRGVYISDWFPVNTHATYMLPHNIGTGNIEIEIFYNEFKSESALMVVYPEQAYYNDAAIPVNYYYYSFGAVGYCNNPTTLSIYTGHYNVTGSNSNGAPYTTGINLFDVSGPGGGGGVNGIPGYYKVYAYRNW